VGPTVRVDAVHGGATDQPDGGRSRSRGWGHVGPYGEHEPITGFWGLCPQRGPGEEPLVRGQSPVKLNTLCCQGHMPEMAQSCYVYELFYGR